jgi:MHS family proline/betaine transporter-like MFS transporter
LSAEHPAGGRRTVLAGAIGNVLEWYDFAVYGYLAPVIGTLFFPADDPFASLLSAFGVFAVGYAARPLGGAVLGEIGDRIGRKPALILSVVMMGVATSAIGLLPDYARIGIAAPMLLVALRIVQGISVGGEYSGSIVFLAEQAPPERRGYFASWPMFGSVGGFLLGSAVGALVSSIAGEAEAGAGGSRSSPAPSSQCSRPCSAAAWSKRRVTRWRARPWSPHCATIGARSCG